MKASTAIPLVSVIRNLFSSVSAVISRLRPSFGNLLVTDMRTFRTYSVPIEDNSIQATDFLKISPLSITAGYHDRMATGLVVYDAGFRNTAVRKSHITYIDGNRGALQYRQYPIDYLFAQHDYEDVMHLLIWGAIPTPKQKTTLRAEIAKRMTPDGSVTSAIHAFDPKAPAFLMITAGLSAWAASHPESVPIFAGDVLYTQDPEAVDDGIYRSLAAFAVVASITNCHQQGTPFNPAVDQKLSLIENMLIMMGRVDKHGRPIQKVYRVLNKLWILFADHEMTNSTAAFLHAASSLSDPISASIASVASANGPLHAGAIDMAYKHIQEIGSKEGVCKHMVDVRAKKRRMMGVGHRMYRTVDPRIQYIRSLMADLSSEVEKNPLLEVALEIERTVSEDEYFTSRNLCINADLYGSFVYAGLGFDPKIFTQLASTARCAGIMAHWKESMAQRPTLWRPKQVFNGTVAV
ncbi:citrate synthase [Polyplosphaeria fusca]|uniref:Citrate synthase n=1 Tax=Polyplosphaeria fusca TaxID=682080 RepID=A0A9P4UW80_9PLEO|nr:citrate synthase [Polyplosphaeria fusca]